MTAARLGSPCLQNRKSALRFWVLGKTYLTGEDRASVVPVQPETIHEAASCAICGIG